MRPRLVAVTLVVAAIAVSCGNGGDAGHAPPMLSSTIPHPSETTHTGHRAAILVICRGSVSATTQPVVVPAVVDLPLHDAVQRLECEGFRPTIDPPGSDAGVVISQTPEAGAAVPASRAVRISVRKLR